MIPKANNPSPVSKQPILSQANQTQHNSVQTAAPVTAQPSGCNPFSACFAVKNSVGNIESNTNGCSILPPLTKAEKVGIGAYFCVGAPAGIFAGIAVLPTLGVIGGTVVGAALGVGTAIPSFGIAKQIVTQQEQTEVKKQD